MSTDAPQITAYRATCLRTDCTWTLVGDDRTVTLAARRHGGDPALVGSRRPGHPTSVEAIVE